MAVAMNNGKDNVNHSDIGNDNDNGSGNDIVNDSDDGTDKDSIATVTVVTLLSRALSLLLYCPCQCHYLCY